MLLMRLQGVVKNRGECAKGYGATGPGSRRGTAYVSWPFPTESHHYPTWDGHH